MLYPQSNLYRQCCDLSGFWDLRFDPGNEGSLAGWSRGFTGGRPAAVPASWNDQFEDYRDYLGNTWYQTRFSLPWGWDMPGRRSMVRFNSVNYLAEVWLNGVRLGCHEGGHLPFEFEITPHVRKESNLLVVRVEGELALDRVPPGNVPQNLRDPLARRNYPAGAFDFFPFCGIQRQVLIYTVPQEGITDLRVVTGFEGSVGTAQVSLKCTADAASARFRLGDACPMAEVAVQGGTAQITLEIPDVRLWSPVSPFLYDLEVELVSGGTVFDRFTLPVGIRTIEVAGDAILLNHQPVYLKGLGRHEDFPVVGRGLVPAVIVKDYALMKWLGANSFRTTHYPYSDQMMDLADRLGFLVIDETPAVGLFFAEEGLGRRLDLCRQYTHELIDRDKNHPSVIMWSLANEPDSNRPAARDFFQNLYQLARSLDATRPTTMVSCNGLFDESFDFLDVLCLNRYYGWYEESGQLDAACARLSEELDTMHARFGKPLILTEFGADTIPGCHAQPVEMFSEEFQADLLTRYIQVLRSKTFVVGEHVWNLCDFKTGQAVHRMGGMNYKGIFTRDRRPKMAAHKLRDLWQ